MKRLSTIMMLVVAIIMGSVTADAKTTKKSSSSKAKTTIAAPSRYFSDGCPDISGHTYFASQGGDKVSIHFGTDGLATIYDKNPGSRDQFTFYWSYEGNNIVTIYSEYTDSTDFQITDNGKALITYMGGTKITFRITK